MDSTDQLLSGLAHSRYLVWAVGVWHMAASPLIPNHARHCLIPVFNPHPSLGPHPHPAALFGPVLPAPHLPSGAPPS